MENLTLVSSPKLSLLLGYNTPQSPRDILSKRQQFSYFLQSRRSRNSNNATQKPTSFSVTSSALAPRTNPIIYRHEKLVTEQFASISSSNSSETTSVGANPQLTVPPPPSQFGSPLFWVGVGVGISALFSWAATNLKKYAMQQAFKTMMGQMDSQNNQFSNASFSPGTPFTFPTSPTPRPTAQPDAQPTAHASRPAVTVDVAANKVEASAPTDVKDETEVKKESNKYAFVDVSPEDPSQSNPFESFEDATETSPSQDVQFATEDSENGSASKQGTKASEGPQFTGKASGLSVEALEKMMEDPTVQKMVFPYLPEEMRDTATFKWMLQNPQYRQQLEEMLNNMSGGDTWNNNMMDSLKNFDLSSPEVKQQFDQIGLTPEEVISKIMANPDVAMAFQNPRVQAAIMDCSQNPMSIAKYQNDQEVMAVFNKISELFPGATGSV